MASEYVRTITTFVTTVFLEWRMASSPQAHFGWPMICQNLSSDVYVFDAVDFAGVRFVGEYLQVDDEGGVPEMVCAFLVVHLLLGAGDDDDNGVDEADTVLVVGGGVDDDAVLGDEKDEAGCAEVGLVEVVDY